jgi:hypothetical protein
MLHYNYVAYYIFKKFAWYINDLPDAVKSSVRLLADDCLLYRIIKSAKDHQLLQEDLKNLESWANDWSMRFNLCIKNIFSQLFIGPHIPYKSILESSFLCGTVSKALEKSKMATSVCNKALYAFMKSWSVTNNS